MPLLSNFARQQKLDYFFEGIDKKATILEVGSGEGWVKQALKAKGYTNYTGLDILPPADIVGDVRQYRKLGLKPDSYDAIVLFEVVEHVDCFQAVYDLLKPGGKALITTPLPGSDWILQILEFLRLNQKRTSPHDHLVDLKKVNIFPKKKIQIKAGLSQWAIFTK